MDSEESMQTTLHSWISKMYFLDDGWFGISSPRFYFVFCAFIEILRQNKKNKDIVAFLNCQENTHIHKVCRRPRANIIKLI